MHVHATRPLSMTPKLPTPGKFSRFTKVTPNPVNPGKKSLSQKVVPQNGWLTGIHENNWIYTIRDQVCMFYIFYLYDVPNRITKSCMVWRRNPSILFFASLWLNVFLYILLNFWYCKLIFPMSFTKVCTSISFLPVKDFNINYISMQKT